MQLQFKVTSPGKTGEEFMPIRDVDVSCVTVLMLTTIRRASAGEVCSPAQKALWNSTALPQSQTMSPALGGGEFIASQSHLLLKDAGAIIGNRAQPTVDKHGLRDEPDHGGGVYIREAEMDAQASAMIANNTAGWGAGLYLTGSVARLADQTRFATNVAAVAGGCVVSVRSHIFIGNEVQMIHNMAPLGAFASLESSTLNMTDRAAVAAVDTSSDLVYATDSTIHLGGASTIAIGHSTGSITLRAGSFMAVGTSVVLCLSQYVVESSTLRVHRAAAMGDSCRIHSVSLQGSLGAVIVWTTQTDAPTQDINGPLPTTLMAISLQESSTMHLTASMSTHPVLQGGGACSISDASCLLMRGVRMKMAPQTVVAVSSQSNLSLADGAAMWFVANTSGTKVAKPAVSLWEGSALILRTASLLDVTGYNHTGDGGGMITHDSLVEVMEGAMLKFRGNTAAGKGGGVAMIGGRLIVDGLWLDCSRNTAAIGGGIAFVNVDMQFGPTSAANASYNLALSMGGGLAVLSLAPRQQGMYSLRGWFVQQNEAGSAAGGAVLIGSGTAPANTSAEAGPWTISDCYVGYNVVHESVCSGMDRCAVATVGLDIGDVSQSGGGLLSANVWGTFRRLTITGNMARVGAGMLVSGTSLITVSGSHIEGNLATCTTGGLVCQGRTVRRSNLDLNGTIVANNKDIAGQSQDLHVQGTCNIDGANVNLELAPTMVEAGAGHLDSSGSTDARRGVGPVVQRLAEGLGIKVSRAMAIALELETCCGSEYRPCSISDLAKALIVFAGEELGPGVSPTGLHLRDGAVVQLMPGVHDLGGLLQVYRTTPHQCQALQLAGRQLTLTSGEEYFDFSGQSRPVLQIRSGSGFVNLLGHAGLAIRRLEVTILDSQRPTHCSTRRSFFTLDASSSVRIEGCKLDLTGSMNGDVRSSSVPGVGSTRGKVVMQSTTVLSPAPSLRVLGAAGHIRFMNVEVNGMSRLTAHMWLEVLDGANATIRHGTVKHIHTSRDGGFAGASAGASFSMSNCVVYNVSARDGAVVWLRDNATASITDCRVESAVASGYGGVAYVGLQSQALMEGSVCSRCHAASGGAMTFVGTLALLRIHECRVDQSVGAAVRVDAIGTARIRGLVCIHGIAQRGACIHGVAYEALSVMDSVFDSATSTAMAPVSVGGALVTLEQARSESVTAFVNCTWRNGVMSPQGGSKLDEAGDYVGGGLGIEDPGDALRFVEESGRRLQGVGTDGRSKDRMTMIRQLAQCSLGSSCGATAWYQRIWSEMAKGLRVEGLAVVGDVLPAYWLVDCVMEGNMAAGRGGAIHMSSSGWRHLMILSSRMVGNQAVSGRGGALYVSAPLGHHVYAINSTWGSNASPMGGNTPIHVSRDVSVEIRRFGDVGHATGNDSAPEWPTADTPLKVSRDGVCDVGWVIPAVSTQECERCEAGGFSWWAGELLSTNCHPCPAGAVCRGGFAVESKNGYYMPNIFATVQDQSQLHRIPLLLRCNPPSSCAGNASYVPLGTRQKFQSQSDLEISVRANSTRCAMGYKGPACGECMRGYGRDGGVRAICRGYGVPQILYTLLKLGFSLYVIGTVWSDIALTDFSNSRVAVEAARLVLCFQQLQLIGVIMGAPGVDIPEGFQSFGVVGSMASSTPSHTWLAPECVWSHFGEGVHMYMESLMALLQAVVLVPVMAALLLGFQWLKVRRNASYLPEKTGSAAVVRWGDDSSSATEGSLHRTNKAVAMQSLRVRLPLGVSKQVPSAGGPSAAVSPTAAVVINPHFGNRRLSGVWKKNDCPQPQLELSPAKTDHLRRTEAEATSWTSVETQLRIWSSTRASHHPNADRIISKDIQASSSEHSPIHPGDSTNFRQRILPFVALLALALYFVPSVILGLTSLLSCTTLSAWSDVTESSIGLHTSMGTMHIDSQLLFADWLTVPRLSGAMRDLCWTGRHATWSAWMMALGLPGVLGTVGSLVYILLQHRKVLHESTTLQRYGVFYGHLKPRCWWWVLAELSRRAYVPIIIGLYGAGGTSDIQTALGWTFVLDLIWLCAFVVVQPQRFAEVQVQSVLGLATELQLLALLQLTLWKQFIDPSLFRSLSTVMQSLFVLLFGCTLGYAVWPMVHKGVLMIKSKLTAKLHHDDRADQPV